MIENPNNFLAPRGVTGSIINFIVNPKYAKPNAIAATK